VKNSRIWKKWSFHRLTWLMLLVLASAAIAFAQKVNVEFDQAADFTKFKTFAIRNGQLNSRNPALNSELVKKQIEADIVKNLTAKGLTQVSSGPADLNVVYHFGSARKTQVEAYPAGWRGWGTRYVRVPYAGDAGDRSARSIDALAGLARNLQRREERCSQDFRQARRHGEKVDREVSPEKEVSRALAMVKDSKS